MVKLPQFTLNASGELVYAKTGKLAPEGYFAVGNTVYRPAANAVGRLRAGSFKRPTNLTQKARKRVESARRTRAKRTPYTYGKTPEQSDFSKQVKKAQKELERAAAAAAEEHGAPHIPAPGDFTRGGPGILIPDQSYQEQIARLRPLAKRRFLSAQEMSAYNFARWVRGLRASGMISEDEAAELWRRYAQSTAPGERTEIWEETEAAYGDIEDFIYIEAR